MLNGSRQFPTDMMPVSFNGHRQLGMLFRCSNMIDDLTCWFEYIKTTGSKPIPECLGDYVDFLNETYSHVEHDGLRELFPDWPRNVVEEWAIDYNNSFMLKFDNFYQADTLQTTIYVKAFGVSNVSWPEYQDTYKQALTMEKLRSNL